VSKSKNRFHPISLRKADLWHRLDLEARAALIVSDERRAWILERYPPDEMGRPLIIVADDGRTQTKVSITDEDHPESETGADEVLVATAAD